MINEKIKETKMIQKSYFYLPNVYLCSEDGKESFIIRNTGTGWVMYCTTDYHLCSDNTNGGVFFKTKKQLLENLYEGKKITCKRIKRYL